MAQVVLPCLRGGYSKVETLVANIEAVRFALKHDIPPAPLEVKACPALLAVAELLLKLLETEAERYDHRAEEADPQA